MIVTATSAGRPDGDFLLGSREVAQHAPADPCRLSRPPPPWALPWMDNGRIGDEGHLHPSARVGKEESRPADLGVEPRGLTRPVRTWVSGRDGYPSRMWRAAGHLSPARTRATVLGIPRGLQLQGNVHLPDAQVRARAEVLDRLEHVRAQGLGDFAQQPASAPG